MKLFQSHWLRAVCAGLLLTFASASAIQAETVPSVASLNGSYVFEESGTIGGARVLSLGLLKLDGKGNISGTATIRLGTAESTTAAVSGFYTVNADGTGSLNLNFTSTSASTIDPDSGETITRTNLQGSIYNFVFSNNNTLRAIRTDGGELASASIEKQQIQ